MMSSRIASRKAATRMTTISFSPSAWYVLMRESRRRRRSVGNVRRGAPAATVAPQMRQARRPSSKAWSSRSEPQVGHS